LKSKEDYINFCEAKTSAQKVSALFDIDKETKDLKEFFEYIDKSEFKYIDIKSLDKKS
jgi:hypothetical protein